MAVTYGGVLGYRPSALAGLPGAVSKAGSKITSALATVRGEEIKKEDRDRTNLRKVLQNLADKSQEQQDMFLQGPGGKELDKQVKRVFGKSIEEVIPPSTANQISQMVDESVAKAKKAAIEAGGVENLTPQHQFALRLDGYEDEAGEALGMLLKNPMYQALLMQDTPESAQRRHKMEANVLKSLGAQRGRGTTNDYTEALKDELGEKTTGRKFLEGVTPWAIKGERIPGVRTPRPGTKTGSTYTGALRPEGRQEPSPGREPWYMK